MKNPIQDARRHQLQWHIGSKENISLEESDGEAQTKHRAVSASLVRKVKKKLPNSLDIKPCLLQARWEISQNLTKQTQQKEVEKISEDTFSMTGE